MTNSKETQGPLTAKQFLEEYPSEVKNYFKGIGDPYLHRIIEEYAAQQCAPLKERIAELEAENNDLKKNS